MHSTTPERLEMCRKAHEKGLEWPELELVATPELIAANAAAYAARAAYLKSELGWEF